MNRYDRRMPGSRRGGAWAVYAEGGPRRGPFGPHWRQGPDYVAGDEAIDDVGPDAPEQRRPNAAYGVMPPRHEMGSLLTVLEGILAPGWGAVAVTAIVAGGVGLVVGVLIGESETARAVGRGVSSHAEKLSHAAAGAAVRAMLA